MNEIGANLQLQLDSRLSRRFGGKLEGLNKSPHEYSIRTTPESV